MTPMSTRSSTTTAMTGPLLFSSWAAAVSASGDRRDRRYRDHRGRSRRGIVVTAAVIAVPTTAWPRRKRMRSARRSSADW